VGFYQRGIEEYQAADAYVWQFALVVAQPSQ
jgi:hypothetical protein